MDAKERQIQFIRSRIVSEHEKHPDLDWELLAAKKIYGELEQYHQEKMKEDHVVDWGTAATKSISMDEMRELAGEPKEKIREVNEPMFIAKNSTVEENDDGSFTIKHEGQIHNPKYKAYIGTEEPTLNEEVDLPTVTFEYKEVTDEEIEMEAFVHGEGTLWKNIIWIKGAKWMRDKLK